MDCPLCSYSLSDARPRYRLTLRLVDAERSSEFLGQGVDSTFVCEDCWKGVKDDLS